MCLRVEARNAAAAELAAAEAFAAGALGLEERAGNEPGSVLLLIYARAPQAQAVRAAASGVQGAHAASADEPCAPVDWTDAWRAGLSPIVVSDELVVRPSCSTARLAAGQSEIVIDPGQAFGTGGHESTRLALDLLAALPRSLRRGARVLDVGTGSGVLALAALRLGAAWTLGVDLDRVAVAVALENARRNGLAARAAFVAGSLAGLAPRPFDIVVANLLKRELLPILSLLVRHAHSGTRIVVSGLLGAENEDVRARLDGAGLRVGATRERVDASGTAWLGLDLCV